jgi:phytanoyl-CoA hydroxylase
MVSTLFFWAYEVAAVLTIAGDGVGQKIEEEFTNKARQAGLTEEQARSAFNSNMMATGLLSEFPAEFAKEHGRRWLVSAYEAGDVVLHKPHVVSRCERVP